MKKLMLICAPVTSRSGYGAHARDLVRSFIRSENYDIKIQDVRWGECPRNALDINNPEDKQIHDLIMAQLQLDRQPDIYVDIRIPNEFQTVGKFNIGITAGIETNAVSQAWIEGCNKMDLIIVPSEHSKAGFVETKYDKMQQMPNGQQQKVGELKLEKPMEVVFEGADLSIYKPMSSKDLSSDVVGTINDLVSEEFAFLNVGQWGNGGYGEDRKDLGRTIKVFLETFANKKEQPALILKTNGAAYSIMDREEMLKKIRFVKDQFPSDWKLPNVYLLHGSLSDEEMNELYNHPKVKAMVTMTHGEGFGRPMLEATMVGLPVIASNWSGHVDFLSDQHSFLIGGEIKQVPQGVVWENIIIPQSQWFICDEQDMSNAMSYCYNKQKELEEKGNSLMKENREKFSLDGMTTLLNEIVERHTKDLPSEVGIKLPKLKKSNSGNSGKINLPKLKKPETTTESEATTV